MAAFKADKPQSQSFTCSYQAFLATCQVKKVEVIRFEGVC
jgi:hypothetical protein